MLTTDISSISQRYSNTLKLACPLSLGQTTPTETNHTMPPRQSSVSVSRPGVSRLASWPGVPPPGPAPAHSNSFLPNSVDACEWVFVGEYRGAAASSPCSRHVKNNCKKTPRGRETWWKITKSSKNILKNWCDLAPRAQKWQHLTGDLKHKRKKTAKLSKSK